MDEQQDTSSRLTFLRDFLISRLARRKRRRIFDRIYSTGAWGGTESVSGPGSGVERASLFRADLESLLRELNVRTLLDAPCGDFRWLATFELPIDRYVGVDIVPALVARNRDQYENDRRRFYVADMVCDLLPRVDLILCRDGMVHLCDAEIVATLRNFKKSGSRWMLTNTFVEHANHTDITTGEWRALNLTLPPFNLPPPEQIIDEHCLGYDGQYRDKCLALWSLPSLQV
jgi:hypothetical protein